MRPDTKKISDELDRVADLVEQDKLEEAQFLLARIAKLMTQWVERHLTP